MEKTRIGKFEAISLIVTVMVNHTILNITKTIITSTNSSAILNTIYISIIAIFISYIIFKLLNKFPTFDILDISNFLGGRTLKNIISILFLTYFIFFSGSLLKSFAYCLQTIYYTATNTFFIITIFLIASTFVCCLKNNSIFRSNSLTIPLVLLSLLIIFVGNTGDFVFQNVFPVLGNGIIDTFFIGASNLFAFQGLLHLLFLPPRLKDINNLKNITLLSILFSALYLICSVYIILLLFDTKVTSTLLLPVYSAARYIEFGTFFQRLDSVFILIWIISFVSYLSIIITTCCNIFRKVMPINSNMLTCNIVAFLILAVTFLSPSYAISTFFTNIVYKFAFFFILVVSMCVMCFAFLFKNIKKRKPLIGGIK